jgi:hypothetical protein
VNYMPNSEYLKKWSKELITARRWGIGIITTLLGVGMLFSEIGRVRALWPDLMVICYVALFALTGVLVWLWVWATQHDLVILWRWLDPERYKPPSGLKETVTIVLLGVLLSALFFASRDPLFYAIVFSAYSLVILFATKYLDAQLGEVIVKSRERLKKELAKTPDDRRMALYTSAVDLIEYHFLKRPHRLRHALILVFSVAALALAILYKSRANVVFGVGAYATLFATIVVSEIFIAVWRIGRDDRLRPIEEEVDEIERQGRELKH